jgi:hypothetical protein
MMAVAFSLNELMFCWKSSCLAPSRYDTEEEVDAMEVDAMEVDEEDLSGQYHIVLIKQSF